MSQMLVKWVPKGMVFEQCPDANPVDMLPVVPLSALRGVATDVLYVISVTQRMIHDEYIRLWENDEDRLAIQQRATKDVDWQHTEKLKQRLLAILEEGKMIDMTRFESAPCYLCGYNGAGYYNTDKHPCAAKYHDARHQAGV